MHGAGRVKMVHRAFEIKGVHWKFKYQLNPLKTNPFHPTETRPSNGKCQSIDSFLHDSDFNLTLNWYMPNSYFAMQLQKVISKVIIYAYFLRKFYFNPLSANPTKWWNTLKQFVGKLPTNCLSVFDHFVKLALKGLRIKKDFIETLLN